MQLMTALPKTSNGVSVPVETAKEGLTFFSREFRRDPLVAFILILLIAVGGLVYTVVQMQDRLDRANELRIEAERDKLRIVNEMTVKFFEVSSQVGEIQRELEYHKELLQQKKKR